MSEREILRNQARRLGVIPYFEEVRKSISKTWRYFRISRASFCPWCNRYQKFGKVERSHTTDEEEFYRLLDGVFVHDTNLFNEKVRES